MLSIEFRKQMTFYCKNFSYAQKFNPKIKK